MGLFNYGKTSRCIRALIKKSIYSNSNLVCLPQIENVLVLNWRCKSNSASSLARLNSSVARLLGSGGGVLSVVAKHHPELTLEVKKRLFRKR